MPTCLPCMPTHLLCMREDLDLLLTRAPWGIPMMLPQAAQTTLTRLMSQVTRTIVLPRMPCQVTQALMMNHKKVIQVNLQVFRKRDMCNNVSNQLDYSTGCSLLL